MSEHESDTLLERVASRLGGDVSMFDYVLRQHEDTARVYDPAVHGEYDLTLPDNTQGIDGVDEHNMY